MGRPVAQFPSKSKLEEVAARSAKPKSTLKTTSVDQWPIRVSVPEAGASYPSENRWDELVVAAARTTGARPSTALRCAAQEMARFYVEHGAYPDDSLRTFLTTRCGATVPSAEIQVVFGDFPAGTSQESVESGLQASAKQLVDQRAAAGSELGVGFALGNGRATLVGLSGKSPLRIRDFSPVVSGNAITLQGDVSKDMAFVSGYVTQGETGVKPCEPDHGVKVPAFRLECPLSEADQQATIELVTGKPNQLFWRVAARIAVRRDASSELAYQARAYGENQTVTEPRAFRAAFLDGLNQMRKRAGVGELQLEDAQSSTNERLAPHFFENSFSGKEWLIEEIGLGLLAGWDVNGMIRSGAVFSAASQSSRNPGRFLAESLDSPFSRWVLLEPEMTRVAIGTAGLDPSGVLALVTTYSLFVDSQNHRADEDKLFAELNKVRKAHGVTQAQHVASDSALRTALAQIAANAVRSDEALNDAMRNISGERQRGVRGYVLETSDLQHVEFPDDLVSASTHDVEIGVTHYKARGGAWGQYAILFVMIDA
ncbi:MAG: hypothetical protein QM756_19840 [Polyangiaceae bacterium]